MKISIVVLCYESTIEKIIYTLSSIMSQKYRNFELVITDDGSQNKKLNKILIEKYLHSKGFHEYKIIEHKKNIGTVSNLFMALRHCSGDIVKPIGPGDMFYSPFILENVSRIPDFSSDTIYFGELVSYYFDINGNLINHHFSAPRNINCYIKENKIANLGEQFYDDNWISGATIFYGMSAINSLLVRLINVVRYAEDLSVALQTIDGNRVQFLGFPVVYYEYGSGISTGSRMSDALSIDHKNLKRYILDNFSDELHFPLSAFLFATSRTWTPRLFDRIVKRVFVYLIKCFSQTPGLPLERRIALDDMSHLAYNIHQARKFLYHEAGR